MLAVPAAPLYAASVYKWTDENGVVHYGDVIPAQQLDGAYSQIGAGGNVIDAVRARETPEERRRAEEVEQRAREREQRDMLLLQTFTSREEIIAARDDRIATIDAAIAIAASTIDKLERDHQALVRHAADYERKGQPIPEQLAADIDSLDRQIKQQHLFTETKRTEKAELEQQYAADIQRFLELTAEVQATSPPAP